MLQPADADIEVRLKQEFDRPLAQKEEARHGARFLRSLGWCCLRLFDSKHDVIAGDDQRAALGLVEDGFKSLIWSCRYDVRRGRTAGLEMFRCEIVLRSPRIRAQFQVGAFPVVLSCGG